MNSKWVCIVWLGLALLLCGVCSELSEGARDNAQKMTLGGASDYKGFENSVEIDTLARFAVQEHNKKENGFLEFSRVLKAKEQVVSGKMYHLTLEAIDAGRQRIYEAKVWVKPWSSFKQLQEFKLVKGSASCASVNFGAKLGAQGPGWKTVPNGNPEVKEAATCALSYIQQRSNCLSPYELLEIVLAKAKVIENYVKYDLLLKVKSGGRVEKFRVEVCKEGNRSLIRF